MKKALLTTILFVFCIAAFAQNDEPTETTYKNQIGVNATTFIKQFLSLGNNVFASNSPYVVTYKHINNNKGLRAGAGVVFSEFKQNPNNGSTLTSNKTMNIDLRLGYEWQHSLGKRWGYYFGVDGLYSYDLSRTITSSVSGFPPQTTEIVTDVESFGMGAGPVLGVEFKLSKRISFNAETTAYYTYTERRRRQTNPNFPNFNTNEFSATNNLNIIIPTSLFFVLYF